MTAKVEELDTQMVHASEAELPKLKVKNMDDEEEKKKKMEAPKSFN